MFEETLTRAEQENLPVHLLRNYQISTQRPIGKSGAGEGNRTLIKSLKAPALPLSYTRNGVTLACSLALSIGQRVRWRR